MPTPPTILVYQIAQRHQLPLTGPSEPVRAEGSTEHEQKWWCYYTLGTMEVWGTAAATSKKGAKDSAAAAMIKHLAQAGYV